MSVPCAAFIGFVVGMLAGIAIMSLCIMAGDADRRMEQAMAERTKGTK